MNNPFTVTGRIIPSYKKRPRRETRRSLPKANGGVVKHAPPQNKAAVSQADSSRLIAISQTRRQIVVEFGDRLPNRKMILYSVRWCDEIWRCEADNHA